MRAGTDVKQARHSPRCRIEGAAPNSVIMISIFIQYLEESRSVPKNPSEESVEFLKEDRLWTFVCSKASHYCAQGTVVSSRPVIRAHTVMGSCQVGL